MKKTHFESKTNDIRREQFDRLYSGKAIHCDTKEKAKEFLALADSVGYKWRMGESLIEENAWEKYKNETYYAVTNDGILFGNINYIKQDGYQIIEYQLPLKFKVGDRIRIKDTIFTAFNGRVGVIIDAGSSSPFSHSVKVDCDEWSLWFNVKQLEKVEEPKFKVGDRVRINNPSFTTLNGEVGVIVEVDTLSPLSYAVKIGHEGSIFWFFERQLEKVEEPKEETIDDIIKEIKEYQKRIAVLLDYLKQEVKK